MGKDVIVACDFPGRGELETFLDRLGAEKPYVKIGMELFYAEGPEIVRLLKSRGCRVFLDLKLHDIPNPVKRAMAISAFAACRSSSVIRLAAGAECGSDVPAMLLGGAVLMEGRGERATRLLAPDEHPAPMWLVAVFPGYHVSTKAVYDAIDESQDARHKTQDNPATCDPGPATPWGLTKRPGVCENSARSVRNGDARACARSLFNGLQETVTNLHPLTERFCLALGRGGAVGALLTGSGSAVYGLAGSREEAEAIRRKLDGTVRCEVVQTLPDGVMAAHGPLVP